MRNGNRFYLPPTIPEIEGRGPSLFTVRGAPRLRGFQKAAKPAQPVTKKRSGFAADAMGQKLVFMCIGRESMSRPAYLEDRAMPSPSPTPLEQALAAHAANLVPGAVDDLSDLRRVELRHLDRRYAGAEVRRWLRLPEYARFVVKPIVSPKPRIRTIRPLGEREDVRAMLADGR
jgi:hypothetical protein